VQNQELILNDRFFEQLAGRDCAIECSNFSGAEKAYLIARAFRRQQESCLIVVSSTKQGERLLEDLRFFIGDPQAQLLLFPAYNILPYKFLSYHNEIAGNRIRVLYQLLAGKTPSIVVITVEALLSKIIPRNEISRYAELLLVGEEIERDYLVSKLISGGYTNTAIVEEPGDFSIRGGIIDVFSPLYADPLRIEFYGDLVESMRFFSASSQRKFDDLNEAVILPAREVVLDSRSLPEIISRIRTLANELDVPVTHTRSVIDKLRTNEDLTGFESLLPLIYAQPNTIFEYMPQNSMLILDNPAELEKAADETEESLLGNYALAREEKRLCVSPELLHLKWSQAAPFIFERNPLVFRPLEVLKTEAAAPKTRRFKAAVEHNAELSLALRHPREKENLLAPLAEWLAEKIRSGYVTRIVCRTDSQADRLQLLLAPYGLQPVHLDEFSETGLNREQFGICIGQVSGGFVWPGANLALVTDDEIFGVRKQRRTPGRTRPAAQLLDMQELKKDDLIVHNDHGIGQYGGLTKLTVEGLTNDFLIIVYRGGDKLYLPVDRMSVVHKYMGVDGVTPVLDTLGGKSWERLKSKAKNRPKRLPGNFSNFTHGAKWIKGMPFPVRTAMFRIL